MEMVMFTKSLFFPAKNKRLARIISIKSPASFKRSIKVLKKGGVTLTEKRALLLARNRAAVQLRRRNLSSKERKQFTIISKITIPKVTKRR